MLYPFLSADFVVKEEEGGRLQGLLSGRGSQACHQEREDR